MKDHKGAFEGYLGGSLVHPQIVLERHLASCALHFRYDIMAQSLSARAPKEALKPRLKHNLGGFRVSVQPREATSPDSSP